MIRHILFWKYTDTVKAEHKEAEALAFLRDADALQAFQNHPLHIAHRERCKALVTDRLCGDMEAD
mgnify:CR=1 FL=1